MLFVPIFHGSENWLTMNSTYVPSWAQRLYSPGLVSGYCMSHIQLQRLVEKEGWLVKDYWVRQQGRCCTKNIVGQGPLAFLITSDRNARVLITKQLSMYCEQPPGILKTLLFWTRSRCSSQKCCVCDIDLDLGVLSLLMLWAPSFCLFRTSPIICISWILKMPTGQSVGGWLVVQAVKVEGLPTQ